MLRCCTIILALLLSVPAGGGKSPLTHHRWDRLQVRKHDLLDGVLHQESRHGKNTVSKLSIKEGSVGYLQIRRSMVFTLRSWGYRFTLNDRKDPRKSKEIFWIIQNRYNPRYDIDTGCHVWNAGAGRLHQRWRLTEKYREEVRSYLNRKHEPR